MARYDMMMSQCRCWCKDNAVMWICAGSTRDHLDSYHHRPLMHNGASLLLTADVGSIMRDRMFLRLQPHDDDDATLQVLSRSLRVATVKMDPVQVRSAVFG